MPRGLVFKSKDDNGNIIQPAEFVQKLKDYLNKNPQRTFVWLLRESSSCAGMVALTIAYRPNLHAELESIHYRFYCSEKSGWKNLVRGEKPANLIQIEAGMDEKLFNPLLIMLKKIGCTAMRQLRSDGVDVSDIYRLDNPAPSTLTFSADDYDLLRPAANQSMHDFIENKVLEMIGNKSQEKLQKSELEINIEQKCEYIKHLVKNAETKINLRSEEKSYPNRLIVELKELLEQGEHDLDDLLNDVLVCPVTLLTLNNPVITPTGITYSRDAIQQWLSKNEQDPVTKTHLTSRNLVSNTVIAELIQKIHEVKQMVEYMNQQSQQPNFRPC